jgi:hypothetical protein
MRARRAFVTDSHGERAEQVAAVTATDRADLTVGA